MTSDSTVFWLTVVGTACWGVCFLWMYRISASQSRLLMELKDQGKRIESLSKEEHDLIKEVHPNVNVIKAEVKKMVAEVKHER